MYCAQLYSKNWISEQDQDAGMDHQVSGRKDQFNYWLNSPNWLVEIFQVWYYLPQHFFLFILYATWGRGFQPFSWQTFHKVDGSFRCWNQKSCDITSCWDQGGEMEKWRTCWTQVKSWKWGSGWCSILYLQTICGGRFVLLQIIYTSELTLC